MELLSSLAYSLTVKMEATFSSETLVDSTKKHGGISRDGLFFTSFIEFEIF
jgi:hypothetical protein